VIATIAKKFYRCFEYLEIDLLIIFSYIGENVY